MNFSGEQKELFVHANDLRYNGQSQGHYESYFLRANHPSRPLAFWLRYTIFSPRSHPEQAIGEVWAIWFDGEKKQNVATKVEVPFSQSHFAKDRFEVSCAGAQLNAKELSGFLSSKGQTISWSLNYVGDQAPALFFAPKLYKTKFPAAKVVSSLPLAVFNGEFSVNGEKMDIRNWVGSQNHNWGFKHTDRYAWGQVCGFDNAPESFLEVGSAKLKLGPIWTPFMTSVVLRHGGREYALNTIGQALKAKVLSFRYFNWEFSSSDDQIEIQGRIHAEASQFVGLNYYNPPGGNKHCLNSKLAHCELTIHDKQRGKSETLTTQHRAAYEIITDERNHGIEIKA